jgi:glycerophosphoryl diester phosphodiesterase
MKGACARMALCIGHRGAAGLAPENTILAFQRGLESGADGIECDVHRTRDGQLVLMHDIDVSRTTDGHGHINQMTFAEVRSLNAAARVSGEKAWQPVPTLEEYLDLVSTRAIPVIEIKAPEHGRYDGIVSTLAAELRRWAYKRLPQIISFDPVVIAEVARADDPWDRGLLVSEKRLHGRPPHMLVEEAVACGATFLSVQLELLSNALLESAMGAAMPVATWTVNDTVKMEQCAQLALFAITSDYPDKLRHVLTKMRSR